MLTHSDSIDKTGIKTKIYIIQPILEHHILLVFLAKCKNKLETMQLYQCGQIIDTMKAISEIIDTIDNKNLVENICKYIAPYLVLNNKVLKNDSL